MGGTKQLAWLSIATSVATLILKFAAYGLTGSVGILSDALEGLVNLAAGVFALYTLGVAARPADERHAYGHHKAEYFASSVEGLLIVIAAVSIIWTASARIAHPSTPEHLGIGLLIAGIAGALNLITALAMLRGAAHHDSIALEADARHLMTDVWTTAGVVGGLLLIIARPDWALLDPLVACAVALHIIWTGFRLLSRSVDGLMDAALSQAELEELRAVIQGALEAGLHYEQLRTRKAGSRRFIELVLRVPGERTVADAHALCNEIEVAIGTRFRQTQVLIHVEPA